VYPFGLKILSVWFSLMVVHVVILRHVDGQELLLGI
jgi:hypothetical protein